MIGKSDPLGRLTQKQVFSACIWLSKESTYTKIFLLCVARFFKGDTLQASSMSYPQVARDCSMSERMAIRVAQHIVGRWLVIERGKGHPTGSGPTNLYHGIIPPDVVSQLREVLRRSKGVSTSHPLREPKSNGVHPGHSMGCPPVTRTYYETSDERAHTRDQKVTLPQTWSLPADWRQWTRQTFVASDEAIARSAARFHTLKANKPRTAERRLQEWQAWCHGEHAFAPRTQSVVAPGAGISPAVIRGALRTHADGVSWGAFESQLGPAPGQPGCTIAPEYLAEHAQYVAERARRTTGRAA